MTVFDLDRDQMIFLKQAYMIELSDCGEFAEVMNVDYDAPSWGDLAAADELIPDSFIYEHYDCVFSEDDFGV